MCEFGFFCDYLTLSAIVSTCDLVEVTSLLVRDAVRFWFSLTLNSRF